MSANRFQDFAKLVESMEGDFEKFYDKEVGAAGTRVRKHLQEHMYIRADVHRQPMHIRT